MSYLTTGCRLVRTPLGKMIEWRTEAEFFRVTAWVAWMVEENQKRIARWRATNTAGEERRLADQPWRTDGRAEAQRAR